MVGTVLVQLFVNKIFMHRFAMDVFINKNL